MSNSIWHKPGYQPAVGNKTKVSRDGGLIYWTAYGWNRPGEDVHDIGVEWAYVEDVLAQADKAERLQKAVEWLVGGDTGVSSKTMCAALFGATPKDSDMPHDAGDFGRCRRFIRFMPDGTKDIVFKKLSDKPEWVEIGKRWDELVDLYDQENWAGIDDILRTILKECRQPRPNEIFIGL